MMTMNHVIAKNSVNVIAYISSYAIFGSSLRIYLSRIFGSDCTTFRNVSSWNTSTSSSSSSLSWNASTFYYQQEDDSFHHTQFYVCVTSSSNSLFYDLPSNIVGSFFMGFISSPKIKINSSSSSSSSPSIQQYVSPFPWLKSSHPIQDKKHVSLALRSAFCGSLTTYSSWNTSMILLIIADTILGKEKNNINTKVGSGFVSALLGYFIGLTCCIVSFIIGKDIALFLHNRLGQIDSSTNQTNHRMTSPLEVVQVLHEMNPSIQEITNHYEDYNSRNWSIEKSNITVDNHTMYDLETRINNHRQDESYIYNDVALHSSSIMDKEILSTRNNSLPAGIYPCSYTKPSSNPSSPCTKYFEVVKYTLDRIIHWNYLPILGAILLLILYVMGQTIYHQSFYQQMWMSSLCSIPGALLRWKLSEWLNNTTTTTNNNDNPSMVQRRIHCWKWIPWGTFLANMLACIISVVITAWMKRQSPTIDIDKTSYPTLIAMSVKVGFAGSLSTVSTFVKEIIQLYDDYPSTARSYYYSLGSLFLSCILCLALYCIMVV